MAIRWFHKMKGAPLRLVAAVAYVTMFLPAQGKEYLRLCGTSSHTPGSQSCSLCSIPQRPGGDVKSRHFARAGDALSPLAVLPRFMAAGCSLTRTVLWVHLVR